MYVEGQMSQFDFQRILAFIIRFDFKFNHKKNIKEQCYNILRVINSNSTIADKVDQTVEELMKDDRPH